MSLPSDVTFVDPAVELARTLLRYQGQRDPTEILLVLRELLKNAVVHGNRNLSELTVSVAISRREVGQYCVEVEDQGAGFDARRVFEDPPPTGRGFSILRSTATEVRTSDRGNRVTVILDTGE